MAEENNEHKQLTFLSNGGLVSLIFVLLFCYICVNLIDPLVLIKINLIICKINQIYFKY
jgi:hypothetical protein